MFESGMEITLQLCYVFARHCDVFLLHYNYIIDLFDVVTSYVSFLFVIVTYFYYVIITLLICSL